MLAAAIKTLTATVAPSYAIDAAPSCSAGPWKVFSATQKSTGQPVSVFVFDRKLLASPSGLVVGGRGGSTPSRSVQNLITRLKKEAANLARLRHPSILRLIEPVEETRSGGLMFVTERVTTSLATLLRDLDASRSQNTLGEVEIQKGLVQIGKGLEFLHYTARLVHGNLTPAAVLIDSKGDWKLSGFTFAGPENVPVEELIGIDHNLPDSVQLNLNYASPDIVIDTNLTYASDLFSLGLLIVALYNNPHDSPLQVSSSTSAYRRMFASSSTTPSRSNRFLCSTTLPEPMLDLLSGLITRSPVNRLNSQEFQQARYFDNILVSTLRFLDEFPAKTPVEKSQFMRGIPQVLPQFSSSILEKSLIPVLTEQIKDPTVSSLALQSIFKAVALLPPPSAQQTLVDTVLPAVCETLLSRDPSPDRAAAREGGLTAVVNNLSILSKHVPPSRFNRVVVPLYQAALQSRTHAVVDAGLQNLRPVLASVDFPTLKNELFPHIASVFSKTNSLAVKISSLNAFWLLCGGGEDKTANQAVLDKYTIQDKILPLLRGIKTKEPAVMMAVLAVFQEIGKVADIKFIASDVLPLLWSFSLGPLLNLSQFEQFVSLINALSNRVIEEHGRSLRELSGLQDKSPFPGADHLHSTHDNAVKEVDFNSLVLGQTRKKANQSNPNDLLSLVEPSSTFKSNLSSSSTPSPKTYAAAAPSRKPASPVLNPPASLTPLVPQKPPNQRAATTTTSITATNGNSTSTLTPTSIDWSGAKKQLSMNSLNLGPRISSGDGGPVSSKPVGSFSSSSSSSLSHHPVLQPMKAQKGNPLVNKNGTNPTRAASSFGSLLIPPPPKASASHSVDYSQHSLLDE